MRSIPIIYHCAQRTPNTVRVADYLKALALAGVSDANMYANSMIG